MDLNALYQRTVEGWEKRLEAVGEDEWGDATPCTEWSVRDLVNHVTGENLWTAPLMRGSTIEEVGDRFDGDLLGDDPTGVATRAAAEAREAVAETLPQHGVVHLSYGEESMDEYVRQLAADLLIHGWDLAAATGGDTGADPEVVADVAAWFAEREEMYRSGGAIADRAAATGEPWGDLLAAFGRDRGWAPPA